MNIVRPSLLDPCRIICVSDIHGSLEHFRKLLDKCNYAPETDYLFILGDIVEKGTENLETLQYVRELCKNPKTLFIKGNNDTMPYHMAYKDGKEQFLHRIQYRPVNTFLQMAQTLGITDFSEDFEAKRQKVIAAYKPDLDFLQNAPMAIETPHFIFVHAGIEDRPDWENGKDEWFALTTPWYLRLKHQQSKTVICGHYPTYNFRRGSFTNLPIFDSEKRIIDIDGGMNTKYAGQINALIINVNGGNYDFDVTYVPAGEETEIISDFISDKFPKYVDWENHIIKFIEQQGDFMLAENTTTGEKGLVPASFTGEWNGLHSWIHLDSFPTVRAGEKFFVVSKTENYLFGIAQSGKVGFIPRSCIKNS